MCRGCGECKPHPGLSDRTLCEPDIPRLRKLVAWVEEQDKLPEWSSDWNQDEWRTWRREWDIGMKYGLPEAEKIMRDPNFCETAYCVAGKVANEDGYTVSLGGDICEVPDGTYEFWRYQGVDVYAADALGLCGYHAMKLFAGNNDAKDIRVICEQIAEERL